ncbi:MAG: AAA family ATPase [Beijerinckiaceae bacterium]|jgi:hypothetical protein
MNANTEKLDESYDFRDHIKGGGQKDHQSYRLQTFTAAWLGDEVFPETSFIVPRYVAQGLTILAGRPKAGKSYLALNIAVAIATGGSVLNEKVEHGDVLYLALEDNKRRLQGRLDQMIPFGRKPERLHLTIECNRLDKGGLEAIEAWCRSVPRPRGVIVDVFGRIRADKRRDESPYDYDYRTMVPLKGLADRLGIAVIVIHHTNKRQDVDDPLDAVSSTTGFTGAADTILILAKGPQGPTLYGKGRDIEEVETALRFDRAKGQWTALGDAGEVRRTDERKAILDTLSDTQSDTQGDAEGHDPESDTQSDPMSPSDIADETGMKVANVKKLLSRMVKSGEVLKVKRGLYARP